MPKKIIFTAAAGSAEVVLMLKSCGGRAGGVLDTFFKRDFVEYIQWMSSTKTTYIYAVAGNMTNNEDILWWKMTFGGGLSLVEDYLQWKMTFGGRRPLVEDNLWQKTTFGGR